MYSNYAKTKFGFTLIELLVVISVIALLSTLALVALNRARMKARDARRLADIGQLQKALDLYYDKNNAFPISGNCGATTPNGGWCNSVESLSSGYWVRNGATNNLGEFLNQDPIDPKKDTTARWAPLDGGTYFYYADGYGGPGQWYMIIFGLEDRNHSYQEKDGVRAPDGSWFHYGSGNNGIITVGRNYKR